MYPKDVFHEQRLPGLGHVGGGGGALGDGARRNEPGSPFLDSGRGEDAQALARRSGTLYTPSRTAARRKEPPRYHATVTRNLGAEAETLEGDRGLAVSRGNW